MIHDPEAWQRWESQWQSEHPAEPQANIRIFMKLLEMAQALGAWPPSDPLEGIETDIALVREVNTYVEPPATLQNGYANLKKPSGKC